MAPDLWKYILHADYFHTNKLLKMDPPDDSAFIRIATEQPPDEMVMDDRYNILTQRSTTYVSK